jgi:hypothetical protein
MAPFTGCWRRGSFDVSQDLDQLVVSWDWSDLDEVDLSSEQRDLLRRAVFIESVPYVRRVVFIATPHRGSYLTEYPVAELLGRFLTLPMRIVQDRRSRAEHRVTSSSARAACSACRRTTRSSRQWLRRRSLPAFTRDSIIAVVCNGPGEGSNDGVVEYSSSHLDGVDSEYIVRSTHSVQSNSYAIEEVHRILLVHAADVYTRIACGKLVPPPPPAGMQALRLANVG